VFFALLKEDFDLVDSDEFPYFPCISAKFICLLKRKPLVITWLEVWDKYWFEYLGIWGIFGYIVERFVAKLPNHIISISEKSRKNLISLDVVEKKIITIPIGIDFEEIEKVQSIKEYFDCIFAGRLIKEKNVDILIKSVDLVKREIPNVKCLIIGDGPEKEKLEKMTRKIGLENNVQFLGFIEDHDDVISYMKSSKIFVLPSIREGFGVVVLEANACGLPVITINHKRNAAADLIEDEKNGLLVDLSENLISEKIIKLLKDDKLREEMSGYSAKSIKKYNWDNIINKVEETYKMVIK
jgi:glycosyltransferase involved in cell wall biosynthesis